ncbi:ParB/RepB/Spo0J family partition protein, partial [bacterium]|nr:ParB/RepB/Spo0J family partition protein [bacterium]
ELVESIKNHGVLEPLLVVKTPAGTHIIAGERRWRAAKKAGLEQVPVHLVKTNPKGMLEMAIIENVQRVNLTALEKAQAMKRLINEFGYTQEEVAQRLGKSRHYVSNNMQLLDLPDPIKDGLNHGLITEGHAHALYSAGDPKDMVDIYKTVIAEGASVRRTEALVRFRKQQKQVSSKKIDKFPPLVDIEKYTKTWQNNWQKQLQSKPTIALTDSRKGTRIVITLKGDPQSRQHDLEKILQLTSKRK